MRFDARDDDFSFVGSMSRGEQVCAWIATAAGAVLVGLLVWWLV